MRKLAVTIRTLSDQYSPLLFHLTIIIFLFTLLYQVGEVKQLPNNSNFIQWDAGIYQDIAFNGYSIDIDNKTGNTGFFPLFPYIWRISALPPLGIGVLNFFIFFICIYYLIRAFKIPHEVVFIYLSIPSIVFFSIPFTESFFFLSSTFILIGWKKKNYWFILIGGILASISRPSFLYFIPAVMFVIFYNWGIKNLHRKNYFIYLITLLSILIGFGINLTIYDKLAGDPLAFFHMRTEGNSFSLPVFPLTTWRGAKLLWLDGLAFMVCLVTSITCLRLCFLSMVKTKIKTKTVAGTTLFAIGFISIILVHILFFNSKDPSGKTSLLGLNRFVFATPFFLLLVNHYWKRNILDGINKFSIIVFLLVGIGFLGVYSPSNFPAYLKPALYILVISLFWVYRNKFKTIWIVIYLIQCVLQVLTFDNYLKGLWIG